MTTSRFDPVEDKPYGRCLDCGITLATQELAHEHMSLTLAATVGNNRSGHGVSIANQPRAKRVESAVESLVDDAITNALDELEGLIDDDHITREEATAAIRRWSEFADEWGNRDDEDDENADQT